MFIECLFNRIWKHFYRFFATGKMSLNNNVDLMIFTNSDVVVILKVIDVILIVIDGILTKWKLKASCLSNIL